MYNIRQGVADICADLVIEPRCRIENHELKSRVHFATAVQGDKDSA